MGDQAADHLKRRFGNDNATDGAVLEKGLFSDVDWRGAMEAGIAGHVWSIEELVGLLEA